MTRAEKNNQIEELRKKLVKSEVVNNNNTTGNMGTPDDYNIPFKATITDLENQISTNLATVKTLERMFKTTGDRVTELEKSSRSQGDQV